MTMWFFIALMADVSLRSCGDANTGQPYAIVRTATHTIDVGVCGSKDALTARSVEAVIDRPRPADAVDVHIADRWSFTMPATELAQIHSIRAPAGPLRITMRAKHYRDASGELRGARTTIALRRLPVIRGRVLSVSGQPLQLTSIQPVPGAPCFSRFDGTFDCEIAEEWPRTIAVAHANMATHVVRVDKGERDIDLGDVRLSRGARLSIQLEAPHQLRSATMTLFRDSVQIAERKLQLPSPQAIAFANLEPGTLRLLVRGSRPLQQLAADVKMTENDSDQKISIAESELTIRVYSGTRPEGGSSVVLKSLDGNWSGTAETDDAGSAVEPLWQLGTFTAAVRAKNSASPMFDHREFSAGEKQEWTINLPIGRIEGVVRNEEHTTVAEAEVNLTTESREMSSALHTKADAEGRFAFDGVRSGAQTVGATAEGYLPADSVEFNLGDSEELRRVDLTLHRGQRMNVDVVDGHGVPVANAIVIVTLDSAVTSRGTSDSNGHAALQLSPAGSPVLFVIPTGGSFAIHRVTTLDRDLPALRIVIPEPAASLELKTETTEHKAVRDVHFLVRYDGENIPFNVLMELGQRFGIDFATRADGTGTVANLPLGLYELWPFANAVEAQTMAAVDVPAPLRVAITPGVNSATLTFRTKRR
jgi:hypothetical protein